jgi:hypothetical protein
MQNSNEMSANTTIPGQVQSAVLRVRRLFRGNEP